MSESNADLMRTFQGWLDALEQGAGADHMHLLGTGAVAELEAKLRRHYGMRYALCVSSATTGLLGIALALGLKRSHFVTTPYTYGASIASWLLLGNTPIFADIEPATLTLDPEAACRAVTPKTKAILAVDVFGMPCDMAALRSVADELGVWYIADAAQSFGAYRDGLPASSLADALVVSFTTGKALFAGEGGAVLTNHRDLYEKLIWFTQHPERQRRELGLHLDNELAVNGRLHPLSAIWANNAFSDSLARVEARRTWCLAAVEQLAATGLVQCHWSRTQDIQPSFSKLALRWRHRPQPAALKAALTIASLPLRPAHSPIRLLTRQPPFLSSPAWKASASPATPAAAAAEQNAFCLEPLSGSSDHGCRISTALGRRRCRGPQRGVGRKPVTSPAQTTAPGGGAAGLSLRLAGGA